MRCSKIFCHCRFKNQQQNFLGADSEISRQTMSLSIQKSAPKNYIPTDSEIGSDGGLILALPFFWVFTRPFT
jgi:hypothetical protein